MSGDTGLAAVATAALGSDAVAKKDHDAAMAAAVDKAKKEGAEAGKTAGATEAKARIKAIVTCEQAKGREALAAHFAYDTDMPAEAAMAVLDKAPKQAAAAPSTSVAPLLANGGAPNPQVDAAGAEKPADDFSAGKALVAALKANVTAK